jgi:hypothetical protein
MNIFVAILALHLRNLEDCGFALRYVALVTGNGHMAAFQRILCGLVIFRREGRWFEAIDGMARGAFGAAAAFEELCAVVVLMAIHAPRKGYLRLEVPVLVAIFASQGFVLAKQWVFRLRVVKSL